MGSIFVAILVGACTPQARPSPPPSPPIGQASGGVNAVTWAEGSLSDGGDVYRIEHVAASSSDLVAIGYDEAGPGSRGAIWHSSDGVTFERVDDDRTAGVVLTDVAAGPGGFVAVGSEGNGPDVVVLVSSDGLRWERASAKPELASASVSAIATDDNRWMMIGTDPSGAPISWLSWDGLVWDRRDANALGLGRGAALVDVAAARDFWLAAGAERDGTGAMFVSDDGERWRTTTIPSAENGATPTRLSDIAVSATAVILRGQVVPSCDLFAECEPVAAGWWSTDAESWSPLPETGALAPPAVLVPGASGFLSIAGSRSYASTNGLSWSPLSAPGGANLVIHDAVAFGDSVIAVGERTSTTGTSVPWLANGALTMGAAP